MSDFVIEKMKESDCEAVALLERECFSVPWSSAALSDSLKNKSTLFFVCKQNDKLAGYISAYIACDEASVINLAVFEGFRKKGVGTALVEHLKKNLSDSEVKSLFLEVRKSNLAAQRLYANCGFSLCGKRNNFYTKPSEDALLYCCTF